MGGGAFGALGGLVMVVSLFISMRKQPPGPVGKLVRYGATSPETAVKPRTANIARDLDVRPGIRRRLIVELEDGRCWVDTRRLRRFQLVVSLAIAIALGLLAEAAWLFLRWIHAL